MPAENTTRTSDQALERIIHRQIELRTGGRLRRLHVALGAGGVVVRGFSPSYYVKQLVLAAVWEVLPSTRVDLDIEVLDNFARAPEGRRAFAEQAHRRQDAAPLEPCASPDEVPDHHTGAGRASALAVPETSSLFWA